MSYQEIKNFTFVWKILNYSLCYKENGEAIESPEFTASNLLGSNWKIQLYPNGENQNYIEYVGLFLKRCDENNKNADDIVIDLKFELVGYGETKFHSFLINQIKCPKSGAIGCWDFMRIDELMNKMKNLPEDILIIRYTITKSCQGNKIVTSDEAFTVIDTERCYFCWNIRSPINSDWVVNKIFFTPNKLSLNMDLSLQAEDILIKIYLTEEDTLSKFVKCKLSLIGKTETAFNKQTHCHLFNSKNRVWRFPFFIKRSQLSENFFSMMCEFSISSGKQIENNVESNSVNNVQPLLSDFRNMYVNKEHCDLTLRVQTEEFPAHKCVLAARSPVFSTMFRQNMIESQTGIINITDFDGETMNSFLCFLYTGTLDEIDDNKALKLLVAADKYQVLSLVQTCSAFLQSIMSDSNVSRILVKADMLGLSELKTVAIDFIKTHSAKILTSSDWMKWIENNYKLGMEVLHKLSIELGTK